MSLTSGLHALAFQTVAPEDVSLFLFEIQILLLITKKISTVLPGQVCHSTLSSDKMSFLAITSLQ